MDAAVTATAAAAGLTAAFAGRLGGFELDVRFAVPARGVTALFGPSGCGKTTVLRCVAGLTRLPVGELVVDGEVWQRGRRFLPPHRRPVGYVFQDARLFPHLSVTGNLRFGHKRTTTPGQPVAFDEVAALLGLADLLDRPIGVLSGGERQRVAIGRALLSKPRLLLMDEPVSALDRISKNEILPYLEALHAALDLPVLYVSHDLAEVERLADTMVLMTPGRVQAVGPLADLLADPSLPLYRLPDAASVLDGVVVAEDATYGLSMLRVAGQTLFVPGRAGGAGSRRRLRIAASDVSLWRGRAPRDSSILNVLPARITGAKPDEVATISVFLALGREGDGPALIARITRKSWDELGFWPGDQVHAMIKSVALIDAPQGPAPGQRPRAPDRR